MQISISALSTIFIMRVFVFTASMSPSLYWIFQDRSYHAYYGLLLIIFSLFLKRFRKWSIVLGIGLGLLLDDIGVIKYVFTGLPHYPVLDYWSPLFILPLLSGLLILILIESRFQK